MHVDICNARVIAPTDINSQAEPITRDEPPAMIAAQNGLLEVLRLLMTHGVSLDTQTFEGLLIGAPRLSRLDITNTLAAIPTTVTSLNLSQPLAAPTPAVIAALQPEHDAGQALQQQGFFGRRAEQNSVARHERVLRGLADSSTGISSREEADRLNILTDILAESPENMEVRLDRARLLSNENLDDYALVDFSYILERYPDNVAARLGRATLYERGDNLYDEGHGNERALDDYRHVLTIYPQNQSALAGVDRLTPSSGPRPE